MNIVFADHPVPKNITKSLFLAGPSPREIGVLDWRHEAIDYLKSINFQGTIFVPIPEKRFFGSTDLPNWNYHTQVEWECLCRDISDTIVFWVPRSIEGKMPGFVTNIEFGEDLGTGKVVYGRPPEAEKCKYLDKRMMDKGYPVFETLSATLDHVAKMLGDGSFRKDGEVHVPLFIWKSDQFQSWYANLLAAGNTLESARVHNQITVGNNYLFAYVLSVKIWVASERRLKSNEFVFSRKDSVNVCLYYKDVDDTKIVLVKEFRSTVNNMEGFVYELPGGSSFNPSASVVSTLKDELHEEVGFTLDDDTRLVHVDTRQVAATFATHQVHLYKLELNKSEYEAIVAKKDQKFGNIEDGEVITLEVVNLKEIFNKLVDFSVIGMIFSSILENHNV